MMVVPHLSSPPPQPPLWGEELGGKAPNLFPTLLCWEGSERHRTGTSPRQVQVAQVLLASGMDLDDPSNPNVGSWQSRPCPSQQP